jgi:GH18 family chitinase
MATAQNQKVGWSTGYYSSWAQGGGQANYTIGGKPFTPDMISWKAYTHIIHFGVTPNNDGTLNEGGMGLNATMMKAFVAAAHANGVKAIICIGGGGTGNQYSASAANLTVRTKFIQNIVAFMQKYGYDGADVDWEDNVQAPQYLALFQELRTAFDKLTPKPLMTVAVAAYFADQASPSGPYIDQMNNMSYWTPVGGMDAVMQPFTSKGVPKTKQGVGIGLDYNENPMEVDCDPIAAKNKALYAINKGYGGIMVWEIEMDARKYNGQTPIHDTLAHYVEKSTTSLSSHFSRFGAGGILLNVHTDHGSKALEYSVSGSRALKPGAYIVRLVTDRSVSAARTLSVRTLSVRTLIAK